ncbi:hypothetical protein Hanom_Chr15g01350021 [Helianthus anomalus]
MERWTVKLKMKIQFSPHPAIFNIKSMLQFCSSLLLQCPVTRLSGIPLCQVRVMSSFSVNCYSVCDFRISFTMKKLGSIRICDRYIYII